jgi:hypothetical protein
LREKYSSVKKAYNKKYGRKWREINRDKLKQYRMEYNIRNKSRIFERDRLYRIINKIKIKERNNRNAVRNREVSRQWRQRNRDKIRNYRSKYNEKNKFNERKYRQNKYISDVEYRIKHNLGCRLRVALNKNRKADRTIKLIGCTIHELKEYIEKQFKPGMSWSNYGLHGWHIDHIVPCDVFDLLKEEEQKKCFHYTNLQPLSCKDNLCKSNKLMVVV